MKRNLAGILGALTLEEKASLCSGKDFWTTKSVERLGILSWMMTDGPHGLRKQRADGDHLGLRDSVPATCFPSGAGLASSWNRELVQEIGEALGKESKAEKIGVILGPAVNIKRSPLCGRNFEYFSEDPYLAGELAKHHIMGVQSQGVGASLKHFAANNQEKSRLLIDAIVDERTLREIYLPAFEIAVKEAQPWTVMCSYNKINGTYSAENPWLLTRVLKKEWGHTGIVVTDWGACNDRVEGLKAGEELEMPGNGGLTDEDIVRAVKTGTLAEAVLDEAVTRILEVTFRVLDNRDPDATFDSDAHHALARRAAAESMVLLKNDGGLLPLKAGRIAFLGAFARTPRYQGAGSSHIRPTKTDDALEEARLLAGDSCSIQYAPGYSLSAGAPDARLLAEARTLAAGADAAVVFVGLTEEIESEGFDRSDLKMPGSHAALLSEVCAVQKNVVVVLSNGAPIEMPWAGAVPAILEGYLGGQAWGGAVADLLFGRACPSGKLAETFPVRLEDNPSYLNFPGEAKKVEYREGIFVGYRYYDAAMIEPLFPFGHGLSYTRFEYSNVNVDKTRLRDTETLTVCVDITNAGESHGMETVQLYVRDLEASVVRPLRELKGFRKVSLKPGERKTVVFSLDKRAFAFWSSSLGDWVVETGKFEIAVGTSSRDIRGSAVVTVDSSTPDNRVWDFNASLAEVENHPAGKVCAQAVRPRFASLFGSYEPGSADAKMIEAMVNEMPLRNLVRMGGRLSKEEAQLLLDVLNGKKPATELRYP